MTLTEAAFWTKRFGVIAIGFIVILVIIVLFIVIPPPPPPPEYEEANFACTDTKEEFLENVLTIPSLEILSDSEVLYEVQTDTGKLDDEHLPKIVNVYKYSDLGQGLDYQAQAKILAKKMGFDPEKVIRRGTTEYIWYDSIISKGLVVNSRDLNFSLTTNVSEIRRIRKEKDLPTESEAISIATNTLRSLGLLEGSFTESEPQTFRIDINPDGSYSKADSLLNAELIRVDFRRKIPMISIRSDLVNAERIVASLTKKGLTYMEGSTIVDDKRVQTYEFYTFLTYQNPIKSNVSVYIGPEDNELEEIKNVYQIDYKVWSIEPESCGTYPLIAPSVAKEKIENGQGSVVFLNYDKDEVKAYIPQNVKRFLITSVNITYYEGLLEQKYLQPVYLFSGQAELEDGKRAPFHIYYPAINYAIVGDKIESEEAPIKKDNSLF